MKFIKNNIFTIAVCFLFALFLASPMLLNDEDFIKHHREAAKARAEVSYKLYRGGN